MVRRFDSMKNSTDIEKKKHAGNHGSFLHLSHDPSSLNLESL